MGNGGLGALRKRKKKVQGEVEGQKGGKRGFLTSIKGIQEKYELFNRA